MVNNMKQSRRQMVPMSALINPDDMQEYALDTYSQGGVIDWAEQPAIIATPGGWIIDGHHRCEAWLKLGFERVPVLYISESLAEEYAGDKLSAVDVCTIACEEADDYITYGHIG